MQDAGCRITKVWYSRMCGSYKEDLGKVACGMMMRDVGCGISETGARKCDELSEFPKKWDMECGDVGCGMWDDTSPDPCLALPTLA